MSHTLSLRVPDELFNPLDKLCKNIDRPRTFIIKKAIENYISEYSDYEIALERLNDKDDKIVSSYELKKDLGL